MLSKSLIAEILRSYKAEFPDSKFDEDKLCHWIVFQFFERALRMKNDLTYVLSALKVIEEELGEFPFEEEIRIGCVGQKVVSCSLWRGKNNLLSAVNLSDSDILADALSRLAGQLV